MNNEETTAESDTPESEADNESAGSHWKALVEEIGVEVAPSAASTSQPRSAEFEAPERAPKKEQARPRASSPAPGRQHWAGLAGELGIDFPDPPPEPEEPQSSAAAAVEEAPPASAPAEPEPEPAAEAVQSADDRDERGTVVTMVPENLIEDMPAAVTDMLDEVEEPDFGGEVDEAALDEIEEAETEIAIVDDDDEDILDAEVVEDVTGEAEEDSESSSDEDEEEDRPRRRRGRRRGGRRRRRGGSEQGDADESSADEESIAVDQRDDDSAIDDDLPASDADEDEGEDDRPRRRGRSRGRGERRSRSRISRGGGAEGIQVSHVVRGNRPAGEQEHGRAQVRRRPRQQFPPRRTRPRPPPVDKALGDQVVYNFPMHVGQPEIAAGVAVGEPRVVEAQQAQDRRM